jgi:hypothetical protein
MPKSHLETERLRKYYGVDLCRVGSSVEPDVTLSSDEVSHWADRVPHESRIHPANCLGIGGGFRAPFAIPQYERKQTTAVRQLTALSATAPADQCVVQPTVRTGCAVSQTTSQPAAPQGLLPVNTGLPLRGSLGHHFAALRERGPVVRLESNEAFVGCCPTRKLKQAFKRLAGTGMLGGVGRAVNDWLHRTGGDDSPLDAGPAPDFRGRSYSGRGIGAGTASRGGT